MCRIEEKYLLQHLQFRFQMSQIQHRSEGRVLPNGWVLFFGAGRYDAYCMYVGQPIWNTQTQGYDIVCAPVTDICYYRILGELVERYGAAVVYEELLVRLYNQADGVVREQTLQALQQRIWQLMPVQADRDACLTACMMVYYGMVAEEHAGNPVQQPVCGKLMKLYALHLYLMQGQPLLDKQGGVCHMLRGGNPQDILQQAARVGIFRQVAVLYL